MNRKELISKVAQEFDVKPGQAAKMVDFMLNQLVESGLSDEGFKSPIMKLRSKDYPSKVVQTPEGEKLIPARKITKMIPSQEYVSPAFATSN